MKYIKRLWKVVQFLQIAVLTWAFLLVVCLFWYGSYSQKIGDGITITIEFVDEENVNNVDNNKKEMDEGCDDVKIEDEPVPMEAEENQVIFLNFG